MGWPCGAELAASNPKGPSAPGKVASRTCFTARGLGTRGDGPERSCGDGGR